MLAIEEISVCFKKQTALQDLSLSVASGQVFGLLGPNGAGKTTLIRALMGLQGLTRGRIRLFEDLAPVNPDARRRIGYMPQQIAIYDQLTVAENLRFFAQLYEVDPEQQPKRIADLLDMVELDGRADAVVNTLSGGMKRRVMLATTLIHEPSLLILDEPTAGVDPILRQKFWQWFRYLCDAGTSILVTTHHINEAQECDDIAFLRQGRLIGHGSPDDLCRQTQQPDLESVFIALAQSQEVTE